MKISERLHFLIATSVFSSLHFHGTVGAIGAQLVLITHCLVMKEKPLHCTDKNMEVQKGKASGFWPNSILLMAEPRLKANYCAL